MAKKKTRSAAMKGKVFPKRLRGDRIRLMREKRGMTQLQLAVEIKGQPYSVWRMEAGEGDCSLETLARTCIALKCSSDFLLDLSDSP